MNTNSPLMIKALRAIKDKSADRLNDILGQGLDPNSMEHMSHGSGLVLPRHILYAALLAGDEACLKALLDAGAKPAQARTSNDTPLNRACAQEKLALAKLLIDAGDDVNAKFDGDWSRLPRPGADGSAVHVAPGWTVVHTAASVRSLPLLQLLESHGAKLDVVTEDGRTPIMLTVDSAPATQWLLQSIPHQVNAQDKTGVTALINAVATKNLDTVRALLAAGADAELVTRSGVGPIGLAQNMGFTEIAEQLSMFAAAKQAKEIIGSLRADLGIAKLPGMPGGAP